MNNTPRGNRLHIAIFGRRNAGKSSLINALTNQDIALVSDVPGTTTDPVYKAMEILPIGPVLIIDTAGIDDEGQVGVLRIQKTKEVLNKTDLALLVTNREIGVGDFEEELLAVIKKKEIPVILVYNKSDIFEDNPERFENNATKGNNRISNEVNTSKNVRNNINQAGDTESNQAGNRREGSTLDIPTLSLSAKTGEGIEELKELIIQNAPRDVEVPLMGNLIGRGDTVILVTPIDSSAPKGRMILPQVQTIRDILDHDAFMMVCKETELEQALNSLKSPPKLVVTDSQAFDKVSQMVPREVPLTSFSILFARYKGDLRELVEGARAIKTLKPGDNVLIVEGCTHHRQDDDIGAVKIPRWLQKEVGGGLNFNWISGVAFEEDLSKYQLIVHCGSCMHNRREMMSRIHRAQAQNVPIVNYGVLIAYVTDILDRVIEPFGIEVE